jgi:hypothetical protein
LIPLRAISVSIGTAFARSSIMARWRFHQATRPLGANARVLPVENFP